MPGFKRFCRAEGAGTGADDNSPAFQGWAGYPRSERVPRGTAENDGGRPQGPFVPDGTGEMAGGAPQPSMAGPLSVAESMDCWRRGKMVLTLALTFYPLPRGEETTPWQISVLRMRGWPIPSRFFQKGGARFLPLRQRELGERAGVRWRETFFKPARFGGGEASAEASWRSGINFDRNSPVRFHKTMLTKAVAQTTVHALVHALRPNT